MIQDWLVRRYCSCERFPRLVCRHKPAENAQGNIPIDLSIQRELATTENMEKKMEE